MSDEQVKTSVLPTWVTIAFPTEGTPYVVGLAATLDAAGRLANKHIAQHSETLLTVRSFFVE